LPFDSKKLDDALAVVNPSNYSHVESKYASLIHVPLIHQAIIPEGFYPSAFLQAFMPINIPDIVILSICPVEHITRVGAVLSLLEDWNIPVSDTKSFFGLSLTPEVQAILANAESDYDTDSEIDDD
jgi:hypothetical protein